MLLALKTLHSRNPLCPWQKGWLVTLALGWLGHSSWPAEGMVAFRIDFRVVGAEHRAGHIVGLPHLCHLLAVENHFTFWFPQEGIG